MLLIGVGGALVLRGIFIALGAQMIASFAWTFLLFGAILLATAVKVGRDALSHTDHSIDVDELRSVRLIRRFYPVTDAYAGTSLTVREGGRRALTPLALVAIAILGTDIVFAIDSVPAVYGITGDPYLVFATNAFALLGLRALYFVLEGALAKLVHLGHGLSLILAFIGVKLVLHWAHGVWPGVPEIPTLLSLGVILGILAVVTLTSLLANRRAEADASAPALRARGRAVVRAAGLTASATPAECPRPDVGTWALDGGNRLRRGAAPQLVALGEGALPGWDVVAVKTTTRAFGFVAPRPVTSALEPTLTAPIVESAPLPFVRARTLVSAATVKVREKPSLAFTVIELPETAVTSPRIAWWVTKPLLLFVTHTPCRPRSSRARSALRSPWRASAPVVPSTAGVSRAALTRSTVSASVAAAVASCCTWAAPIALVAVPFASVFEQAPRARLPRTRTASPEGGGGAQQAGRPARVGVHDPYTPARR